MNALTARAIRVPAGGSDVPVTLRSVALRCLVARNLAGRRRPGSRPADSAGIENAEASLRDHAVNWLALALLLAAWNVEARLDDIAQPGAIDLHAVRCTSPRSTGLDWTERRATRWARGAACAAQFPGVSGLPSAR